jgi:ABC-2 type transport system ATP-binding protein
MTVIQFKNVCKDYRTHRILDHIDLQIEPGEFFGLVGVNGAGKTTLIKSLLDLCEIEQGDIYLFGVPHTIYNARTHLSFLPEHFIPPYYLTGQNFLAYIARLQGQIFDLARTHEICRTLDFAVTALEQPVQDYSKGMAQKLGLIASILSSKSLLVWDEPMSGLDPKARAYLKNYLLNQKGQGKTLFFSTHLLPDVEALCDRMAILHEGRLKFVGTPAECCSLFATSNLEQAYLNCIEQHE